MKRVNIQNKSQYVKQYCFFFTLHCTLYITLSTLRKDRRFDAQNYPNKQVPYWVRAVKVRPLYVTEHFSSMSCSLSPGYLRKIFGKWCKLDKPWAKIILSIIFQVISNFHLWFTNQLVNWLAERIQPWGRRFPTPWIQTSFNLLVKFKGKGSSFFGSTLMACYDSVIWINVASFMFDVYY